MTNEKKIERVLEVLGVPCNLSGFRYLKESLMLVEDPSTFFKVSITKDIYPVIANKFNSTSIRVERAMRHAIEVAFDRIPMDLIDKYFGSSISPSKSKPTNAQFIVTVSQKLDEILEDNPYFKEKNTNSSNESLSTIISELKELISKLEQAGIK